MKKGKRLYINITNKCNVECPFCCMYSKQAITDLLHKNLFLFLEYAVSTNRCTKIILLTNGILLEEHINRLIDFSSWNQILLEIKVSKYIEEQKKYPDTVFEMVMHNNGNLCGSWVDSEQI